MVRRRSPIENSTIQPDLHCSADDQRRLLGESPFFSGLADTQVRDVLQAFRQRHYDPGDVIQFAGDAADRLSIVAAGTVRMARPTPDGQDVLLNLLGPGEHFGSLAELGDAVYRDDVTAHTAVCVLFTTADDFNRILRTYPSVAISTLTIVAARLRMAHEMIEHLSAYPVVHRVASTLLHFAQTRGKRTDDGVLIDVPLSRQDIADMTGAKVETVSRIMSEFRRSGAIESGRRWIVVKNESVLEAVVSGAS